MKPVEKVYAIPLKGWIEIRRAKEPPKMKVTQAERTRSEWVPYFDPWGHYLPREVRKKVKLKVVTYTGGKLVKTVKTSRFVALTKVSIRQGGCLELPEDMAKLVLETW